MVQRPSFHDKYLQSFHRENVKLVNTKGKSIDCVVDRGIGFAGKTYDVDVIIWSTGFRSPIIASNAGRANIVIFGRNSVSIEDKALHGELDTLHGTSIRHFLNFLTPSPAQVGFTANYGFVVDTIVSRQAYIISHAVYRAGKSQKPVIEPSQKAKGEWAMRILEGAPTLAGLLGCTPSYFNKEGEIDRVIDPAEQMKMAKFGMWPYGFLRYYNILERWRAGGSLKGKEVSVIGRM
ncbi:hypothetical protein LTR49_026849 [Elasticomyces elasticus]|nr:hypothetical protein LTR49_026849 [Elasticomyces elasticus]